MGAPSGARRSAEERLQAAQDATARLCSALRCPSCQGVFGTRPMQSNVCGHTLCATCADLARESLSACPVNNCRMPARPVDLCEDRTVRDIAAAAAALRAALNAPPAMTSPSPPPGVPPEREHEICVPDSDDDDDENDKDASAGSDRDTQQTTQPPRSPPAMRVCVTGAGAAITESAQRALRALGAEGVDWSTGQTANVVLTALDGRREFRARSRALHYALAADVPIVDVGWAMACAARGRWLPLVPFLASRPPAPSRPIFADVAAFVDCGTEILADDVRNWLRAAGAILLDDRDASAQLPNATRMFVHVVPDLRRGARDIGPLAVLQQCARRGIDAVLRDVPWLSDCLVSRACPPAMGVLAETMGDTMGDTMGEEDVLTL